MDFSTQPTDTDLPGSFPTYNRQGGFAKPSPAKPFSVSSKTDSSLQISLFPNQNINGQRGARLVVENKSLTEVHLLSTLGAVAEGIVRKRTPLELDLSGVENISSMCIGVVMNIYLAATEENTWFQVNAQNEVKEKLDLCSVGSVINLRG